MWFKQGITSFNDSNFDMEDFSSLVEVKLLLTKILDNNWNKLVCKLYIRAHYFHARVQSPTCTTYGKCLGESIISVLTLRSGICRIQWGYSIFWFWSEIPFYVYLVQIFKAVFSNWNLITTTMFKIFWEFRLLYQQFFSQVKRSVIISNKNDIY